MKVTALKNIDSLKYGLVGQGEEKEVDEEIALIWIKHGLADGKVEISNSHKGNSRVTEKVK
jgi:hypothetical protein